MGLLDRLTGNSSSKNDAAEQDVTNDGSQYTKPTTRADTAGTDLSGSNTAGSGLTGSNTSASGLTGSNTSGSGFTGSNTSSGLTGSNTSSGLTGSSTSGDGLSSSNTVGSDLTGSSQWQPAGSAVDSQVSDQSTLAGRGQQAGYSNVSGQNQQIPGQSQSYNQAEPLSSQSQLPGQIQQGLGQSQDQSYQTQPQVSGQSQYTAGQSQLPGQTTIRGDQDTQTRDPLQSRSAGYSDQGAARDGATQGAGSFSNQATTGVGQGSSYSGEQAAQDVVGTATGRSQTTAGSGSVADGRGSGYSGQQAAQDVIEKATNTPRSTAGSGSESVAGDHAGQHSSEGGARAQQTGAVNFAPNLENPSAIPTAGGQKIGADGDSAASGNGLTGNAQSSVR